MFSSILLHFIGILQVTQKPLHIFWILAKIDRKIIGFL